MRELVSKLLRQSTLTITSFVLAIGSLSAAVPLFLSLSANAAGTVYSEGFETGVGDWSDTTQVASGAIPAESGSYYGQVTSDALTHWGGYQSVFPYGGYTTQVDVYLDMAEASAAGVDKRFDFSSAINNTSGDHRRDFIFNMGTDKNNPGQWLAGVSNNAPGWPAGLANHVTINQTGWYTLKSTFRDNGSGVLAVDMSIIRTDDSTVVGSWTLSNPLDVIGVTVGGNRYGWFTTQRFDFSSLAIDNAELTYNYTAPIDVYVDDDYTSASAGGHTWGYDAFDNLQDSLNAVAVGGTVHLMNDLTLSNQVVISKEITFEGNNHTLQPTFARVGNTNAAAIDILANNVAINELTVDGSLATGNMHGLQAYNVTGVNLWRVTLENNHAYGLVVNGSWVQGVDLHTSNNGWGGVNVDQGQGVTNVATFRDAGINSHSESLGLPHLYVDRYDASQRTVDDSNNQYVYVDNYLQPGDRAYFLKSLAPATPTNLRYESPLRPCGSTTNINFSKPAWDVADGATSYEYQALFNGSVVYGPVSFATNQHPGGAFGGGTNGEWAFQVRSVNALGLKSDWTTSCTITLDTSAPADPVLVSPSNNAVVHGASVTQAWSDTSTDVDHYIYESYNDAGATSLRWHEEFTGTSKTATNVANTTYWWRVKAVDHAGNESAWSPLWKITVDNDAPVVTITSPLLALTNSDVEVRATVSDANLRHYWFQIKKDGVVIKSQIVLSSGIINALLWTLTDSGTYTITVAARDLAGGTSTSGNRSADVEKTVVIDKDAPTASLVATPNPAGGTSNIVTITGDASDTTSVASYQLTIDGYDSGVVAHTINGAITPYDWDVTGLASGTYTATLLVTDTAGNSTTTTTDIVVDNDGPAATITTTGTQATATPTIEGTVDADATSLELTIDGVLQTLTWAPGDTTWSFTTAALADGAHTIQILAKDSLGNEGGQDGTITISLPPQVVLLVAATTTGGTPTPAPTPQATVTPGEVLGDQTTTPSDDIAANAANKTGSVLGSSTENSWNLFGLAWYWWLVILAAIIAIWWFIAAALRRRDEQAQ